MLCLAQECQNPNLLGRWNQESLTHRVARVGVSQNWREALGGSGCHQQLLAETQTGQTVSGSSYSRHCSKLLSLTTSSTRSASGQTSQLLISDLVSVRASLRWAESYSFSGKLLQKSIFFGDKSEENQPQLRDQRMRLVDAEASLAPTPLSRLLVGRLAWLVGRLVCQRYFHIFTLWMYLNPHRVFPFNII